MSVVYSRTTVVNNASRWDAVNDELEKIQTALVDALSRSGAAPNAMSTTLDMGDNDILNVGTISVDDLLIDGAQVPSLDDLAEAYAGYLADLNAVVTDADNTFNTYLTQAAQAVTDAETAETNAQGHEIAAGDYATEAQNWANYPEDQLVPEGDLVDDYSAYHWAQKAEEAAAGVTLPTVGAGDAGKILQVNPAETGYDLIRYEETPAAGFIDIGSRQVLRGVMNDDTYSYEATTFVAEGVQETIGATGAGADNAAAVFDDIPTYAKGVILGFLVAGTATASGTFSIQFTVGSGSSTVSDPSDISAGFVTQSAAASDAHTIYGTNLVVPFDSIGDRVIAFEWQTTNAATKTIKLFVNGYVY